MLNQSVPSSLYNNSFPLPAGQCRERSYLIPASLTEAISDRASEFCALHPRSHASQDYFFTVNNLDLQCMKEAPPEMGSSFSFKMRVRSYGVEVISPYFLEIKYRIGEFARLRTAILSREDWSEIIEKSFLPADLDLDSAQTLEDFLYMIRRYEARPSVLSKYRSKVYLSQMDDKSQIIFSNNYRSQSTDAWTLQPCADKPFKASDQVWLQLKYDRQMPIWMKEIAEDFELTAITQENLMI